MADYQDILKRAIQIRDAVLEGTNTASLVGGVMVDTLYLSRKLETTINQVIKSIKELGGSGGTGGGSIDENTLAAYLINNGYAKLTDIPSSWWGQTANANNVVQGSMSQVLSLLFTNETIALDGIANEDTPTDSKTKIVTPNYVNDKFIPRKEDANVLGSLTFDKIQKFLNGLKIGEIYLSYDSANNALRLSKDAAGKEAANFYALGGITAYGASDAGGGGGLNASVISYARILEGSYTDADLTSIPNAYAIKALSSRIDNIATELGGLNLSWNNITGKPSTFTPSAHTHKWADITDRITKVSQLANDKGYLTAHQSLESYYTKAEIDAKGYTTNKGTVTSVALTLPTGLTCATKTITTSGTFAISLASGYSIPTTTKQTAWDGAVSAKHTHSNKSVLDGITSAKVTHWDSAYDWYALMTTDEETADGIINKWNEVVAFLSNIAQTDTLSGIVDGINKSISDEVTRAKKAEGVNASGISTNKTSITTLQGYFTSGSAKKALQLTNARKLWGNSFNGTADINGSIIVPSGKYISIGNIKMEYDATNKALKITNTTTDEVANLYTSGGVSAYGVGTSSSSGGGLNGSVKSYSNALKLTSESLSEIASAYSIKALDSRISSLEGGSATAISVSGSGNAVTSVTKDGTTISVVKGSTFLTSHQSLDGYVNAISVSGSGNAITSVSKSGKGITFTKGATFLTSHQSLANYYTKSSVDSLLSGKSATSHTHSVKINGVTKTIAASGGAAVDLGTYLTSHQSLNGYATQSWVKSQGYLTSHQDVSILNMANDRYYSNNAYGINMRNSDIIGVNSVYTQDLSDSPTEAILFCRSNGNYDGIRAANGVLYFSNNVVRTTSNYDAEYEVYHKGNLTKLSQLTNDKNFVTGSVSGQTITINGVSTTWQNTWRGITDSYSGTSTGTSLSQKGANSLYNALHNGYASSAGNADTVDGYHATDGRTFNGDVNWGIWSDLWEDENKNKHPWYGFDHRYPNTGAYSSTLTDYRGMTIKTANQLRLDFGTLLLNGTSVYDINVASATKLQTARTIWGQSFNGTANVSGALSGATTISASNTISTTLQNGALKIGNKSAPISAIDAQLIFNTGAAVRFGETAWDWNQWAGLKYNHSKKTIYLGIADGSVFNANSAQTGGTVNLVNCSLKVDNTVCVPYNTMGISFRSTEYTYWGSWLSHQTAGNEALVIASQNDNTAIMFVNGESYANISNSRFQSLTPALMIKNNIVQLGYPYNDFSGDYRLRVNGSTYIRGDLYTTSNILAQGGVTAYSSSDIRLKQDLRKLDYLGIIKAMGGTFGFAWKKDGKRSIGWIAQHVLCNPQLKDIVETDEKGYYKINYWSPKLIATAFGAIEQVDDEVTRLKKKVKTLENRVKELEIK